jgi:hypothetical protein
VLFRTDQLRANLRVYDGYECAASNFVFTQKSVFLVFLKFLDVLNRIIFAQFPIDSTGGHLGQQHSTI